MKQTILKLAKRLKRFTIDDLIIVSELEEKDVIEAVKILSEERSIFRISPNEYAFVQQINKISNINTTAEVQKGIINESFKIDKIILEKEEDRLLYESLTEYYQKYLIKYLTLIKKASHLRGKQLIALLDKIGKQNPELKASYPAFSRIKRLYKLFGLQGILPQYKNIYKKNIAQTPIEERNKTSDIEYTPEMIGKHIKPLFFEYRTKSEIDLIKKCFASEITFNKTSLITDLSESIIIKFNRYFRREIYEHQLNKLMELYNEQPTKPCERTFLDETVYLYCYDKQTFVSKKKLFSKKLEKSISKENMIELKKAYCKLRRRIVHNTMAFFIEDYIAEALFRFNADYQKIMGFLST